jgi:hypothetical protein
MDAAKEFLMKVKTEIKAGAAQRTKETQRQRRTPA